MTEQRNETLVAIHGVSPEHTEEQATAVGNAMLIALGSAGLILSMEMNRFVEIATDYDATDEAIAGWRRFDYANATLEDQITVEPRLARHMMYEAIRIVRPSAPPGPSRKLTAVARTLAVQPATVSMLEAAVTAEEALARARATLERTMKRRPGMVSPKIATGLATIAEQEGDIREMRLKTMENG